MTQQTPQTPPPTPLWQTRRFRIAAFAGGIALLALVLILQNFERIDVQFLFWNARAPIAGVIFTAMLAGAGLQELLRLLMRRRKRKREVRSAENATD